MASKKSLKEAIDKYLAIKDGVLSPSTIRNYTAIRDNHLQPEMKMELRKLNNNVIQSAINREAKEYSAKTVENVYRLLTTVLNQFTGATPNVHLPQRIEKEHNMLNEAQLKILIKAIDGDKSEVPLLLALFLGLRRSEIMALEHSDFDSKTSTLSVTKAKVPDKDGNFVVKGPKSRKGRRKLPVPPYLAKRLKACIDRNEPFFNVAPERPYKRLQQICEKYGLPKMTLHDLRHQNASIMLYLGVPDKYAMERGGWSSNSTMKNIYQHTMSEARLQTDATMNNYFSSLVP